MGHKKVNYPYISVRLIRAQRLQFLALTFVKFWLTVWEFLFQVVRSYQQELYMSVRRTEGTLHLYKVPSHVLNTIRKIEFVFQT